MSDAIPETDEPAARYCYTGAFLREGRGARAKGRGPRRSIHRGNLVIATRGPALCWPSALSSLKLSEMEGGLTGDIERRPSALETRHFPDAMGRRSSSVASVRWMP
jgi:hypothetical protein